MKRREANILFNNALNTFFFNGYMASDMLQQGILSSKEYFIYTIPRPLLNQL